ncbi:hypothetical protein [Frigoribacterium sp. CG_9.8]|uniref:hypothetical protein n=1 Tax=Frigoribacterium sp. CG_9.8 TaxID=2787733 RepID=UPI0018C96B1D|nr:hypothetical protein [Frigoribacterium sp. CG_9.8]MBG6106601.1 hypothetical protein [Frigoribacterium sp. CG_9.8]
MTRITPEADAAVENAGRKWIAYKIEMLGLESRVRARIEADMEAAISGHSLEVARALRAALDIGATKVALRKVTSKNPGTIESFLALLDPKKEAVTVKSLDGLKLFWGLLNGTLNITLDSATIVTTEFDRGNPLDWSALFEVFVRPGDGKVLIDAIDTSGQVGAGVTEWLRADRANEEAVIAWVTANPQA